MPHGAAFSFTKPLLKIFLLLFALTGAVAFGLLAGAAGASLCGRVWPALTQIENQPSPDDFCGKYVAADPTRDLLKKYYPGAESWLDFRKDGTFEFHQIPGTRTSDSNKGESISGTWSFVNPGGLEMISVYNDAGEYLSIHLNGTAPHFFVRF